VTPSGITAWVAACCALVGGCAAAAPTVAAPPTAVAPPTAASSAVATRWVPSPGASWQWQLTGPIDTTVDADVFDIDGVESSAETVAALHRAGRRVVCYVDAGAAEEFRPDRGAFPGDVLGDSGGFDGERLLDVRRLDVLAPIMAARFDVCRDKGFDGIEADLADGYTRDSGFPLTADDQLTYNRMLADLAHERGLSIGLKNDLDQVSELVDDFDFAVNEQCFQYDECAPGLRGWAASGKAVFSVEYRKTTFRCGLANRWNLSTIHKSLNLYARPWTPCR